nr:DUF3427 domain-containing protein [Turicibacter bilis]
MNDIRLIRSVTTQDSERGQKIFHNKQKKINLHLVVRKFKKMDSEVPPYLYIGSGNTIHAKGNKPITIEMELEHKVPASLYPALNDKV